MIIKRKINRRRVLRGTLAGTAITVGLPFLNCFLNNNGDALADTGAPLPIAFGNWFRGLGDTPTFWEPKVVGHGFEMRDRLAVLRPFQSKINIFSGMKVFFDGKPNVPHFGGPQVIHGGTARSSFTIGDISLDQIIAETIGRSTRFRSIEVACDGSNESVSRRAASVINPSEPSPAALYTRIFGPEFQDPNAAEFKPDPAVMVRRSLLSGVADERKSFMAGLGAEDRARADAYFTSLREIENQLAIALEKPAPMRACSVPGEPDKGLKQSVLVDDARATHQLFAKLLAHTLACGQTRVFSLHYDKRVSELRKEGDSRTYHMYTHEEPIDPQLGYQKEASSFVREGYNCFATFLAEMEAIKEGDKTLLDRCAIFYSTDGGSARLHSPENIPLMIAGSAGGRIKTGHHIVARGEAATRVGLTLQQVMGVPAGRWGTGGNEVSQAITEIMA